MFDRQEFTAQLEQMVNTASGPDAREGSAQIIDAMEKAYSEIGFRTRRFQGHGEKTDYLIAMNKPTDHFDILYVAHVDTAFNKGTCSTHPFRMDEQYAYGPGIADMKAGALTLFHFLKNLPCELLSKLSVCAFINADEEIYMPDTESVMIDYASRSDHIFVFESAFPDGSHCIRRKGRIKFLVEFSGIPAHSGYIFETKNASAILEMSHWIQELNAMSSREKGISFNVGTAKGGDAVNMVPATAEMECEFRMWDVDDMEALEEKINYLATHPFVNGVKARVFNYISKNPMSPTPETIQFLERARDLLEGQHNVTFNVRPRGGMSDANFIYRYTSVCLDGMGPRGELNAGDNDLEYVDMTSIEECIFVNTALFRDIAEQKQEEIL